MKNNAINWFEIAVTNFDLAQSFYETILATPFQVVECDVTGMKMAMFPYQCEGNGVGGALVKHEQECCKPGAGGTTVYLNVEGDLDAVLARIPAAGGEIVLPRKDITPHGFIGIFKDPEGNVVGLHSMV
jgi:uncharacterized protein